MNDDSFSKNAPRGSIFFCVAHKVKTALYTVLYSTVQYNNSWSCNNTGKKHKRTVADVDRTQTKTWTIEIETETTDKTVEAYRR